MDTINTDWKVRNCNKMNAILQDVRRVACYAMTQNEFDTRIKPKVREVFRQRLRNLDNKKKRKD